MAKVKQKVSGCFRNEEYAHAYCRISSYLQTMANKGYNPLIAIQYEKGLPYKASVMLSKGLDNGSLEKNLSLLATLYVEAREDDSALQAFKTASNFSSDGKEDLYIAQLFYDKERFKDAIEHAKTALNKGVKNPGSAYMLMASSHMEMGQEKLAKTNLEKASKYQATKKAALRWLSHM
jgi:tetratricopeptide (TPR) repeat protein